MGKESKNVLKEKLKIITIGLASCMMGLLQNCKNPDKKIMEENKVTWFSIPTDNLERASNFYNAAFGWQIEPLTQEENDDLSFNTMVNSSSDENYVSKERGAINGCLVKRKIGLPNPAVLVEVANLDKAIEKALAAGGKLVSDKITMKSLNGTFVFIQDTEGNYVEVFQLNP